MSIHDIALKVGKSLRSNSPTILTGVGISGVLSTAYLTARAAYASYDVLNLDSKGEWREGVFYPTKLSKKEQFKKVWKLYVPAAASGIVTTTCIVGANRIGTKRAAAAYSLLTVSERALSEYREKVIEEIGVKKEQAIRDTIAQDRVNAAPPAQMIVVGTNKVLCFEGHTGRYFESNMETLRRAENDINAQMFRDNEANLNDFYHLVGLEPTSTSSRTGWNVDKMLKLQFSSVISPDGQPCLAFEYNYVVPF